MNNKQIKRIIATVIVLVLGAFSLNYLHAEEVNESKLTNLRYVKKTYKTKCKYVREDGFYYYSSDGKAGFFKVKVQVPETEKGAVAKLGVVNVDDEVYGRVVLHVPSIWTLTCNLHDTEYSVKGKLAAYVSKEEAEDIVKQMKDLAIEIATKLKEETN